MSNLIKENTIFEEVEKKCRTFVNNTPVMYKYKKREVDTYFFNKSIELDLKKAKEEGIIEGVERGIEQGEKNKAISIAKNLKNAGIDIKIISENTGLSVEEIEKL